MTRSARLSVFTTAILLINGCGRAASPAVPAAEAKIAAEIQRLDARAQSLQSVSLPEDLGKSLPGDRELLARASAATSPALKLYRLRDGYVAIELLSFLERNRASGESLDALQNLWNGEKTKFAAPVAPVRGPLVQRALSQAARNRSEKLYRASLAYARVTSPFAGLYYLAEAEANAAFGAFVESLKFDRGEGEKASPAAALESAYESLNRDSAALFEKDPTGRAAIPSSARLKEARELLDRRSFEGATLLMLETELDLLRRGGASHKAAAVPSGSPRDSMAALFQAAAEQEKDQATADAIRGGVLPLYESMAGGRR